MIKVRKAYVLVAAVLVAQLMIAGTTAAFGFSFPFGTIVAGPGLAAAGPTTFNTYFHDGAMANTQAAADVAVNGGGFSPIPGCLPGIPFGLGPFGTAANSLAGASCGRDTTLATSFSTAGAVAGLPALGGAHFAGAFPEFALNLF